MLHKNWKHKVEKEAINLLWSHWIKLGAYVPGEICHASGDPEVLLILTGLMAKKDLRLLEIMGQWLHHYESVVNIERLKTALKFLSEIPRSQDFRIIFKKVLEESLPAHSWRRWNKIFSLLGKNETPRILPRTSIGKKDLRKKLQTHEWILEHFFLLGLRYAFGVTAKADILYFIKIYAEQPKVPSKRPTTGANIAKSLHYDPATVLRALEELKEAGLILFNESSGDKSYMINSRSSLLSWKPKADRFFLDWFSLMPVFQDILSLDEDLTERHESIAIDRLNSRLKTLDDVMAMVPRPIQKKYALDNFLGVSQENMWELYAEALGEINNSFRQSSDLDWGADELTWFLDTAEQNLLASYAYLREFRLLMTIDQVFVEATPLLSHHKNWFEGLFFVRCHSAFRAAVRLAASGQRAESFALMRAALENALYAFHTHSDPILSEIWMERKSSAEARKNCRNKFQIGPILKNYEKTDPYNGPVAKRLYQSSIDQGAHPNADSIFSNLEIKEDDKNRIILTLQLNTNEIPLKHAIVTTARTGGCCLLILENIFRDRFQSSGLSEKLRGIIHEL